MNVMQVEQVLKGELLEIIIVLQFMQLIKVEIL